MDTAFYIVAGEGAVLVENEGKQVSKGSVVLIPPNLERQIRAETRLVVLAMQYSESTPKEAYGPPPFAIYLFPVSPGCLAAPTRARHHKDREATQSSAASEFITASQISNFFPGLRIRLGSRASLIFFIELISSSLITRCMYGLRLWAMPCSPLMVPPNSRARV